METLKIKIKRLSPDTVIPAYAHATDAGLDLTAVSKEYDNDGNVVYGTGIAVEIPEGYVGLLFPRSSNSKKFLQLSNSVGVCDSGFRGEIMFKFRCTCQSNLPSNLSDISSLINNDGFSGQDGLCVKINNLHYLSREYQVGDRIGQLIVMPYPKVEFEEVDELSPSDRGEGGYGSTGR